jgi:hypothetical protein
MGSKEYSIHQNLGDFSLELFRFPDLKEKLDQLQKTDFAKLSDRKKTERINAFLLAFIQDTPAPCFLLGAVNEFIHAVNERNWIEKYSFSHFELWLNLFSGLTRDENYFIRAKIMGRFVPRESYQILFPIGMGKKHPGSHYVTAHGSPDLDTTVASFWGWVDAFSARVGEGLHVWNVPGGPPESQVEIQSLFYNLLGSKCFDHFAKTRTSLALSAVDLLTREGLVNKMIAESTGSLEYDKKQRAVILVDEEGNYLADWRHLDVEGVRKVTTLLSGCIRWFSSHFQRQLIAFFSSPVVTKEAALKGIEAIFALRFEEMEPVKGFTDKQKKHVEACLMKVLGVFQGWKATAKEFWQAMEKLPLPEFKTFSNILDSLPNSSLFHTNGELIENRPDIFSHLEKVMTSLEAAIQSLRIYLDHLGTALMIKKEVFGYPPQIVSSRTEVEEIRSKIGPLSYITVVTSDPRGNQFALGIIPSAEIFKPVLGTVSLRDFCNTEETKIPSYFEVISVVDHHKSALNTLSATTVCIADAQSANVLTAEIAFELNDPYSLSGCSLTGIKEQLAELQGNISDCSCYRILNRILQKHMIAERKDLYFVDPSREYLEYLHYLYAILDDTDLLSKLSYRDVICIASLLNRLKTIQCKKEREVISLEDLPRDEKFVSAAAKRILQNEEMYSLYKKIYGLKEQSIEENLRLCIQGRPSSVFADTKVQNSCCRVGQTKLFAKNVPFYESKAQEVRALWHKEAKAFYEERKDCDLHMHMISTVPGAEDVYQGQEGNYSHQDELWFWIPMEEQAIEHLKTFLNNFRGSPAATKYPMEVEFLGGNAKELEKIFKESFLPVTKKETEKKDMDKTSLPVAILRYKAGLLNSRKAMISPYLPK